MTSNYPEERKAPVRLSDNDQYMVYKHCIENYGVCQIESAIEFRVDASKLANEINLLSKSIIEGGKKINAYHVKSSVERIVEWQKRLGKLPVVPLETVEMDQLKIFKTKATRQIEELKLQEENNARIIVEQDAKIKRLENSGAQTKLDRIRAIVSD